MPPSRPAALLGSAYLWAVVGMAPLPQYLVSILSPLKASNSPHNSFSAAEAHSSHAFPAASAASFLLVLCWSWRRNSPLGIGCRAHPCCLALGNALGVFSAVCTLGMEDDWRTIRMALCGLACTTLSCPSSSKANPPMMPISLMDCTKVESTIKKSMNLG